MNSIVVKCNTSHQWDPPETINCVKGKCWGLISFLLGGSNGCLPSQLGVGAECGRLKQIYCITLAVFFLIIMILLPYLIGSNNGLILPL